MLSRSRLALVFFGSVILATLCSGTLVATRLLRAIDSSVPELSTARFKQFALEQITECQRATKNMRERISAQDLRGAQQAWLAARSGWERSEVITAEYFPDLERRINAWPDAERGFHAIEAKLFGARDLGVLPAAKELVDDLEDLEREMRATTLTAQGLLNGTKKLAYEIGENKAEGKESPLSGNSLAEVRENLASIATAYERVFAPVIERRDDGLARIFSLDLEEIRALVSVRSLKELDQVRLRNLSEWLGGDLVQIGQEIGLESPDLATQ